MKNVKNKQMISANNWSSFLFLQYELFNFVFLLILYWKKLLKGHCEMKKSSTLNLNISDVEKVRPNFESTQYFLVSCHRNGQK